MNPPSSILHQLLNQLQTSFQNLNLKVSSHSLETLSSTVYQVLTARERRYHTIRHVSDPVILKDPIWILAATFYDVVYLQTDKRVHPLIRPALEGFVIDENLSVTVPASQSENTPYYLKLALRVFEVAPGKKLKSSASENKFLSAVVAAYFLCDLIEAWDLFRVLVCIQASVPILGLSHLESHSGDHLLKKLELINVEFKFKKTSEDLKHLVALALNVANHDRMTFASSPEVFLSQVLNLMLETHPVLRNSACSIRQMRMSFQQYYEYLRSLDSSAIFQRFEGRPHDLEFVRLKKKVDHNLGIALHFFKSILISLYLLEAVSMLTGGDAPYLLFTGHHGVWESLLSQEKGPSQGTREGLYSGGPSSLQSQLVYQMLHRGVGRGTRNLMDLFPFAAFLSTEMTDSEGNQIMALIDPYLKGDLSALDFLSSAYPDPLLNRTLEVLSEVAVTRTHQIFEVQQQLHLRIRRQGRDVQAA